MAEQTPKTFELSAEVTDLFRKADEAFLKVCEQHGLDGLASAVNLYQYHKAISERIANLMLMSLAPGDDDDDEAVKGAPV